MITLYPDKILLTKSVDVTYEEGLKIGKLLRDEIKNLTWGHCVGLAAPQIGLNKNVFIALDKLYINPVITWYGPEKVDYTEGCYSLDKESFYPVTRSLNIKMEWIDKMGEKQHGTFMGFQAEVLQHEYDHLQGKLCAK